MEMFIKKLDNVNRSKSAAAMNGFQTQETGEHVYNNGTQIRGTIGPKGLEGKCLIDFAEGSSLTGNFFEGSLVSAKLQYAPGVQIKAEFAQLQQTEESFMRAFSIRFASGWKVGGQCNENGEIESAQIVSPNNRVVKDSEGQLIFCKTEDNPPKYVVVSSIWIYEGGLSEKGLSGPQPPAFEGSGVQIWVRGVGYHRFEQLGGFQKKVIFRYNRNLELYREAIYNGESLFKSVSCYGNGLIFCTKEDYFSGVLIFVLPDNTTRSFECQMDEYWFIKGGSLYLDMYDDPGRVIHFKRKNRRLVFSYNNAELDFHDFLALLEQKTSP